MRMSLKRRDPESGNPASEEDEENSSVPSAGVASIFGHTEKMISHLWEIGKWVHKQGY